MVITAICRPAVERVIGDPLPPKSMDGHATIHARHRGDDAGDQDRNPDQHLVEEARAISLLERIEEIPIPDVDANLDVELNQNDGDQRRGQHPGRWACLAAPEPPRDPKKPAEQSATPMTANPDWGLVSDQLFA